VNLLTIYDYAPERINEQKLLVFWLRHVNEFARGFKVYIIHGETGIPDRVLQFSKECKNINIKFVKGEKCPRKYGVGRIDGNFHVNFNAYNVLKFGKELNEPLIYLDLDAILVHDLTEWWNIINEKEFMGTMHYPIGENLNGGIYSVSNWDFIDFEKLIARFFENHKQYEKIRQRSIELGKNGKRIRNYTLHDSVFTDKGDLKSGDQSLYINYFINTNDSPFYENLCVGWNYFANYCQYDVTSKGLIKIIRVQNRMGYNIDKPKVLHFYAGAKKKLFDSHF
jgi:hypothetical protein